MLSEFSVGTPFGVKITELPHKIEYIWRLLHPDKDKTAKV
jgi:hypothetical protein